MDGDHFTAHCFFVNFAGLVFVVSLNCPGSDVLRDESVFDLPIEELGASVTGPERAIAIEDGDLGA